jgi:hypothetical protein
LVDCCEADRWYPCRHLSSISLNIAHFWHPCGNLQKHDRVKDVCSRNTLLHKEFNHSMLTKQYIIYSHFVTVDY